jgi:uncharacterized membrane protein YhaH (DUF805 family)
MGIVQLFFGFKGRIKRSQYWLAAVVQFVVSAGLIFGLIASLGMSGPELAAQRDAMNPEVLKRVGMVGLAILLVFPLIIWSAAAVYTKRLHDRNKGAIWLLAIYVPSFAAIIIPPLVIVSFISSIWVFVELGCLPGTNGPNRFDDGPSQNAYLDDVFGKKTDTSKQGLGGMEGALAAINAAARERSSHPNVSQAPSPFAQARASGDGHAQFGKRVAPSYGTFNAMPHQSGGFGRKV